MRAILALRAKPAAQLHWKSAFEKSFPKGENLPLWAKGFYNEYNAPAKQSACSSSRTEPLVGQLSPGVTRALMPSRFCTWASEVMTTSLVELSLQ